MSKIAVAIGNALAFLEANPNQHTSVALARDENDIHVNPFDEDAVCWCALGRIAVEMDYINDPRYATGLGTDETENLYQLLDDDLATLEGVKYSKDYDDPTETVYCINDNLLAEGEKEMSIAELRKLFAPVLGD